MLVQIIKKNVTITPKTAETEQQQQEQTPEQPPTISAQNPPPKPPENAPAAVSAPAPTAAEREPQPASPSEQKPPEKREPETNPQPEKPAATAQPSPPPEKPVETRNRSVYLIQETSMAQVRMNRSLKVSDTPLKDSINALLEGPTAEERRRGMISLVPEGSKLLSVRVDGNTAYLDFNQEFRYNTRGREGCAAQIKQIVWTATEFPNVQDVQFLIDGKKVDFLSEGVTIHSPIGR
jgi:spore germination protein GerM